MAQNQETILMTLTKSTKGTHVYGPEFIRLVDADN